MLRFKSTPKKEIPVEIKKTEEILPLVENYVSGSEHAETLNFWRADRNNTCGFLFDRVSK